MLRQDPEPRASGCNHWSRGHSHELEPGRRPAGGVILGRFAHDGPPPDSEQGGSALGGHGGGAEAPSDDKIEVVTNVRPATGHLRPFFEHVDPGLDTQHGGRVAEKSGAAAPRVDQQPVGGRKEDGQGQAGKPGTTPQVGSRHG